MTRPSRNVKMTDPPCSMRRSVPPTPERRVPGDSSRSAIDALLGLAGVGADEDERVNVPRYGVPVTARDRGIAVQNDLRIRPRHRLPPFLGKSLSGCAGLVDLEVDRLPLNHVLYPQEDHPPPVF